MRAFILLSVAAVALNEGSRNQTPGRSFAQAFASTAPLMMGTSTCSPVRLSVMVMVSATELILRPPPLLPSRAG